jgi:hypothetical protein
MIDDDIIVGGGSWNPCSNQLTTCDRKALSE